MTDILSDKVAIVTGAGRGIGRAIALGYAQAGARVVVVARTPTELYAMAQEIEAGGGRALAIPTDISQAKDVELMVNQTLKTFGHIHILVNNAGVAGPMGLITQIDEDDWGQTLAINLKGAFLCCRAVVPSMIAARGGNIVNISSGAGQPKPRSSVRSLPYQVSKFGLEGLTNGLAVQLREYKINVNSLLPGMIATRFHDDTPPERIAALGGKMGHPEHVIGAAIYLASRGPGELTGQIVNARD